MTQQERAQAQRIFEQPADAISFYSDFAQILGTENEVVLQLYETIPGSPGPEGHVKMVRTRLRATVMVSHPLAKRIGELLLERASQKQGA